MKSVLAVFLVLLFASPLDAGELRVGAAAENITPALGAPMAGYYSPRTSEGVLDDLYAKAIVIERDGVKVAMVVCDLVTMPHRVTAEARELIAGSGSSAKIKPDHVMISATHTHTGPIVIRESAQDPIEGDPSQRSREYAQSLPHLIAKAVEKADAKLAPARLRIGMGHKEGISFNRRFIMKKGPVGWNPGKLNPNIDRPAGPIDPDVPVVLFESADATHRPIATHVSFALHLDVVSGTRISADFAAPLAAALAKAKGPEMLTVYATGACGDINHIDVSTDRKQEGPDEAKRIGDALAEEVIKTYASLRETPDRPLRARSEVVPLPLAEFKPEEVEAARDVVTKPGKARMSMDRVKAFKVLDVAARKGKPLDAEVQVIALGDELAWVALPGEIFVELGLDIKKRSPFKQTIIVELANGSVGYVPTKRAFADGSYEPVSARCAPGSGEMLVEAALKLLADLHRN